MGERRKRQRPTEDNAADAVSSADLEQDPVQDPPAKRARKETNAQARRSLFIRSLPPTVNSEELTALFSQSYPIKHATVVLDPATKQSKGYGFVTFADAEDAQRAQEEFHGHALKGRKLKVEVAEPRSRDVVLENGSSVKSKSTLSTNAAAAKKAREEQMAEARKPPKLIVRNLPWSIKDPEQLAKLFRSFGKVKHATLPKAGGKEAGFGFIVMRGKKNAEKAMAAINGTEVDGRPLAVDWAVDKEVWEQQKKGASGDQETTEAGEEKSGANAADEVEISEDENEDVMNFMRAHKDLDDEEDDEDMDLDEDENDEEEDGSGAEEDWEDEDENESDEEEEKPKPTRTTDNSSTLFIRNLPFTTQDQGLKEHFSHFGPVRYARVVMERGTDRTKGTGFVCFFNEADAISCLRGAPRVQPTGANAVKKGEAAPLVKHSVLQNESADPEGLYTLDGRVLQVAKAVERDQAVKLTEEGHTHRDKRDKDKRRLYLLGEGTISKNSPLYKALSPSEVKMRQESATQRKKLIQNNPSLHISLTRLSIRNLPRNITSKDLKSLAREAVVGFAKDVKEGKRAPLSKEEEARGGEAMKEAERQRKLKGKGIVKQAKVVYGSREGAKVSEDSGAGRSRGYGFLEYSSHRWALMGLRWLNGHPVVSDSGKKQRVIAEFAIEHAQVVARRKELEEKARVHSQKVQEEREKEGVKAPKKVLGRDSQMAKTRKGTKKGAKKAVKGKTEKEDSVEDQSEEGKLARRQQIIAKKRMARRARKKGKK